MSVLMRFGVCAGIDSAALAASVGYDYIELSVTGDLIPDGNEDDWYERRKVIESLPLLPDVFNLFIRARIVGPDVDFDHLERYVNTALRRASTVDGRIIVFGSGGARRRPDDFPEATAHRQLLDFLKLCGEASHRYGVAVAIEPLNRGETNMINSVAEGAEWVHEVGKTGVRNLADTFHMEREGENLENIVTYAEDMAHAHTADTGRFAPGTGSYDHVAFFSALKRASYDERVSVECSWQNRMESQLGASLQHLRDAYNAAEGQSASSAV